MEKQIVINFVDPYEGDAVAIVQAMKGEVRVCLSLKSNGDTDVWMGISDAQALVEAIKQAITAAKASS